MSWICQVEQLRNMQSNTASRQKSAHRPDRAGLDWAELDVEAVTNAEAVEANIAADQAALESAGHCGVATLVYGGEPFFG